MIEYSKARLGSGEKWGLSQFASRWNKSLLLLPISKFFSHCWYSSFQPQIALSLPVLPWHNIKNGLPQVRTRLWNDIASWRFWNCWDTANPPGAFYLRSSSSHGVCLVVRLIHKISNSKSSTHTCRSIVLWALFELIQLTTSIANCHYYEGIKIQIVDFFVTWTNDFVIIMWPVRNFLLYFAKRAITPV